MSSSTETPLDRYSMAEDVLTDALEQEDAAVEARTGWQQFLGRLLVSRDLAILIVAILIFAFFVAANPRFAQTLTSRQADSARGSSLPSAWPRTVASPASGRSR